MSTQANDHYYETIQDCITEATKPLQKLLDERRAIKDVKKTAQYKMSIELHNPYEAMNWLSAWRYGIEDPIEYLEVFSDKT